MPEKINIDNLINVQKPSVQATTNKLAELANQYYKLILLLIAAVILIAGYFLVLVPKWEAKNVRNDSLMELQGRVSQLQANSEFLSKYSSNALEYQPTEERMLSLALPDEFDLPSIIVQLTKLAGEHNFIAKNIEAAESLSGVAGNSKIKKVDIKLTVTGVDGGSDYSNFSAFVGALESSLMIFDVKAISFAPNNPEYQMELSTYYYPKKTNN